MRSKPVLIVETPPRDVLEAASNKAATYGALATIAFSYRFNVFQTSGGETARPIARSKPRQGEGGEPARVLEALEDMGFNTQIVNDASARHMVNDLSFLNGWARLRRVMYRPAETSADALIVRLAMDNDALMMSNDGFAEWREKYPGLTERLVKFSFTPGYIYLYMGGRTAPVAGGGRQLPVSEAQNSTGSQDRLHYMRSAWMNAASDP